MAPTGVITPVTSFVEMGGAIVLVATEPLGVIVPAIDLNNVTKLGPDTTFTTEPTGVTVPAIDFVDVPPAAPTAVATAPFGTMLPLIVTGIVTILGPDLTLDKLPTGVIEPAICSCEIPIVVGSATFTTLPDGVIEPTTDSGTVTRLGPDTLPATAPSGAMPPDTLLSTVPGGSTVPNFSTSRLDVGVIEPPTFTKPAIALLGLIASVLTTYPPAAIVKS